MRKCVRRILCLLLLIAMSAFPAMPAEASISYRDAEAPEVYANAYTVNVYEQPKLDADVLEKVPFARNLKRVWVKKGWAKVYTVNQMLGYCKDDLLTEINPNTLSARVYSQQEGAPVYRCPDVDSGVLDKMHLNEELHVVAMTPLGDWLRVERNGYYGYIQRPRTDTDPFVEGRTAWCAKASMTVYYDYQKDTPLTTLYYGQEFSLLEKHSGWAKIRSTSNLIGYCKSEDITTTNPNDINVTVYTQADGNFMFKSSTDLSGRIQVSKDTQMQLLAVDSSGFWARVQFLDEYYYIPYVFLGTERRGNTYKRVVTTAGVNIREGTKNSSAIIATVPTGTELWLVDALDNRAKVATSPDADGKYYIGFVELQYLK